MLLIEKMMIIKINVYNFKSKNLNNIVLKIIFNNYKLNILHKTNAKRKKKKEYFIHLNIFRNLNVKLNVINAIFN